MRIAQNETFLLLHSCFTRREMMSTFVAYRHDWCMCTEDFAICMRANEILSAFFCVRVQSNCKTCACVYRLDLLYSELYRCVYCHCRNNGTYESKLKMFSSYWRKKKLCCNQIQISASLIVIMIKWHNFKGTESADGLHLPSEMKRIDYEWEL